MTEKMNSLSDSSEDNGAMVFSKMPALISIGEEDQIFPQLPAAEQQELLCCKLYPDEKNGELSMQELSEVRYLCEEAAVTAFIVDGNNHNDLLCMQNLARYYVENNKDFIIIICQLGGDGLRKDKLIQGLCQKANALYYIRNNYVYWNLVVYLCWGMRAFRLHTKAPEAIPEDIDAIRQIFPRRSNMFLEIIETHLSEKEATTVVEKFLSCKDNLRMLKNACTGYFYLTTVDGNNRNTKKLKELHQRLCENTKDDQFFLTVFELETPVNKDSMLTILNYPQDSC